MPIEAQEATSRALAASGPSPEPRSRPLRAARPRTLFREEAGLHVLRTLSHELRTPLNAIIGFSEIIGGQLYGPVGAPCYLEHAGLIRDSGLRLLHLVNDVIELARLDADPAPMEVEVDDPQPWLAAAVAETRDAAAAKAVRVEFDIEARRPHALFNGPALQAVGRRLIANAVAFSPEGGRIEAKLTARGARVDLMVRDEGPGVASDALHRLMRPFEPRESSLTRHAEGAGLTLAIALKLARAMGADLKLTSPHGAGLCACLRLKPPPLAAAT